MPYAQTSSAITFNSKYLHLPVSYNEDDRTELAIEIDGEETRYLDIYLPDGDPDFWTFVDISAYNGKKARIVVDREDKKDALMQVYQSDKRNYLNDLYKEEHRPQIHFSAIRGWINDPNGLVYYDGEYHLYFQSYPYGYYWGQPHWGHAVSEDLIHWKQLDDAILRHELGGIYSGSSVVDKENTSGFNNGDEDVIVAFYTTTRILDGKEAATQNIAYSNDRGRTFTDYENNPIIGDRFDVWQTDNSRDPKVIWHEPSQKWVMVLYEAIGHSFFTSDNLKDWEYQSHINTFWECPELFELAVDGDPDNKKWVIYGVSGDYLIGTFDGKEFKPESGMHNYLQGKFFAAQTFNNIPESDGRQIQVGYLEIPGWYDIPESKPSFNGLMSFPTELQLRSTANGVRLFNEPVKEIEQLYKKSYSWKNLTIEEANEQLKKVDNNLLHVRVEIENTNAIAFSILFDQDRLYYTLKPNMFYYNSDAEEAEAYKIKYLPELGSSTMSFEFIVDKTSLEVFVDEGRFTMILPRNLDHQNEGMRFEAGDGGQVYNDLIIKNLEVYELQSIWK